MDKITDTVSMHQRIKAMAILWDWYNNDVKPNKWEVQFLERLIKGVL